MESRKKVSRELKNISLTGRLCYLFMCIERYLVNLYPNKDWTLIAEKCWQWTNKYWNEGCDEYAKIVPEYLFEFDSYKETSEKQYDGSLSEKEYLEFVNLYAGITEGEDENEINQLLMLPIDFNNECECTNFCSADESTLAILEKAELILLGNNIDCPCTDEISGLTVEQKNGWGDFIDSRYLSIVLKKWGSLQGDN